MFKPLLPAQRLPYVQCFLANLLYLGACATAASGKYIEFRKWALLLWIVSVAVYVCCFLLLAIGVAGKLLKVQVVQPLVLRQLARYCLFATVVFLSSVALGFLTKANPFEFVRF